MKASALRTAQRIYRRRVCPTEVVSADLAQTLCRLSHDTRRQLGVLIDRRGHPAHVIIGDASKLWLPDIGRLRAGRGRLRGLRLVHTHLRGEALSNDDLTDLALLRLDLVVAITMSADGSPSRAFCAHLLPGAPGGQPWLLLDPVASSDLELDPLALVRSLESEFTRMTGGGEAVQGQERAILVHLSSRQSRRPAEACVMELMELCGTAGVHVLDTVVQRRAASDPRFVIGKGKLEQVLLRANQLAADMLIFDPDLSPAQARAISDVTDLKVIDRSMLILDIFAQHARTRGGKLQVELAQLRYTLPRLVAKNTMMSRLTGGIGGRGPGETKLEINRRRARERIARLNRQLEELAHQRERRRSRRRERAVPTVAIIGYTNVGKSTLLNTLTRSQAQVADQLFATLNPLSRRLRFPQERELVITDTVGFIQDLPQELVDAFRATLEELRDADLLLHVVDASNPQHPSQIAAVSRIVGDLGLVDIPMLMVFNKLDLVDDADAQRLLHSHAAIGICALEAESSRPLLAEIERMLWAKGKRYPAATAVEGRAVR